MKTSFPELSAGFPKAGAYIGGSAKNSEKSASPDEAKTDLFQKTTDELFYEKSYERIQYERRKRQAEIKREQQQAYEYRLSRRRKLKLLLKKHEDYVRFLEETALKKSIAERERIRSPYSTGAEINADADLKTDAKQPMFIRVK